MYALWGDQSDQKFAVGGPQLILRAGPPDIFKQVVCFKCLYLVWFNFIHCGWYYWHLLQIDARHGFDLCSVTELLYWWTKHLFSIQKSDWVSQILLEVSWQLQPADSGGVKPVGTKCQVFSKNSRCHLAPGFVPTQASLNASITALRARYLIPP